MRAISLLSVFALALLLSGCAGAPEVSDEVSEEYSGQGLYVVKGTGFEQAYVSRTADLASYQSLIIAPLELDNVDIPTTAMAGTLARDWRMDSERRSGLQKTWAAAMQRAFKGYVLDGKGGEELRVEAEIIRIAPGMAAANTIGMDTVPLGATRDAIEIVAQFRLYDQQQDTLLAVVKDRRTIVSQQLSRTGSVNINTLFNTWASLLHTRVAGR